jgi:hypothetical protein
MEVVLDAQELERILPVAVNGMSLESTHNLNLAQRVPREYSDSEQRDSKTNQQGSGGR